MIKKEIKDILTKTQFKKENKEDHKVVDIGTTVGLKNQESKAEFFYTVVKSGEADPLNFKISCEYPIGKSMLGCRIGDKVNVELPSGITTYKVLSIENNKGIKN